jgi:O-antigen/teichoic acid export membrane protein
MALAIATVTLRVLLIFRERMLSGFFWSVVSTLWLQGSVLLTTIVVARLLGLEDFGVFALLVGTVMTVVGIAQGSTGLVAIKFVGELHASDPDRVGCILRMCALFTGLNGIIAAGLLFFLAPVVAGTLLGKPQVEPHVRYVALAIVFQVMVAYQHGALQGFGAFRLISRVSVLVGLFHFVVCALGAWAVGLTGALLGFVLASACRAFIFTVALRQECRRRRITTSKRISRADWVLAWNFALPSSLAGLITLPCLWAVTVLVARQPEGMAWVALFTVGHQVRLAVLQLPTLLNAVSFSVLSRLKGLGERSAFRQVFWSNLLMGLVFVSAVAGGLSMVSSEVLSLYGDGFANGRVLLIVLLMASIPELLGGAVYQVVQSKGRMWHSLLFIVLPRDLSYVALAVVLISSHGLQGAGLAYLAAQALGAALTILVVRWVSGTT